MLSDYTNRYNTASAEYADLCAALEKLHGYRLWTGVPALALFSIGALMAQYSLFLPGGLLCFGFVHYVNRYESTRRNQRRAKRKVDVLQRYLLRIEGNFHHINEDGGTFLSEEFPQGRDLDVFGEASLYQYLSICHTPVGKKKLALALEHPIADHREFSARQKAIAELSKKPDFVIDFETAASSHMGQRTTTDVKIKKKVPGIKPKTSIIFYNALSALTLICLVCVVFTIHRDLSAPFLLALIVINTMTSFFQIWKNREVVTMTITMDERLSGFETLFTIVGKEAFESELLIELQQMMAEQATHQVEDLHRLTEGHRMMDNGLTRLLMDGLFLRDPVLIVKSRLWLEANSKPVDHWIDGIAELEALQSLAMPGLIRSDTSTPIILESPVPTISATNMKHLLLKESTAVGNHFSISGRTLVITGSNMSGKTTFLRSIGTNAILAYAGAPVPCQELALSRMHIFTSIRIEDSLTQGISTFYGEILRIKTMVDYAKEKRPALNLIDEIFKGTNSADRITSAEKTIRTLTASHLITILSTHDFELCDLENDLTIHAINLHFDEYYADDHIHFDYLLKEGRCVTTNAPFLLKMAGIT